VSNRSDDSRRNSNQKADWGCSQEVRCPHCPLGQQQGMVTQHSGARKNNPSGSKFRRLPPKTHLFVNGERPEEIFFLNSGWAYRYKLLHDGTRQILDFVLPGDMIGLPICAISQHIDHSVDTITEVHMCALPLQLTLQRLHTEMEFASRII